uniref:Beta-glucosidase n=1 Tax=Ciona savignyi TaxID=51511 RepID=H2YEU9_CIOSA
CKAMSENGDMIKGHFRKDFMWGAATASYQIEGAWDKDGKGQSIWDTYAHTEGAIEDGTNGDITCDTYHKYLEDIKMLKRLKATHYRFSLSWSRLLPTADSSAPNAAGVAFYNKFIDGLLANNIKPCVTLYHWDLPQCVQDKGGWQSEDVVEKFKEYADFCFSQFGDRVKLWVTINEPHVQCGFGFGMGIHAPGIKGQFSHPMNACYQVSRTMLLSHAHTYRMYSSKYRAKQNGLISITLNSDWCEPKDPSNPDHVKAAQFYIDATLGWFAHPIFKDGDYPDSMKEHILEMLPVLSEQEKNLIKGTYDFFGLNHYTTRLAEQITDETQAFAIHPDMPSFVYPDPSWERAGKQVIGSEWLFIVPTGLRKLLNYISKTYGDPSIIITENGCSTKHSVNNPGDTKQLEDEQRCRFITSYLNEALKAHLLDGVDLRGYFLWTLMDNFEWAAGYTERFGLYHVDFEDPARTRTPRKSAATFTKIIE